MSSADPFAAIADPNRRHLLEELRRSPQTVNELAAGLPISRPAVSQHLKVLVQAGLVKMGAEGQRSRYEADREAIAELSQAVGGLLATCCAPRHHD